MITKRDTAAADRGQRDREQLFWTTCLLWVEEGMRDVTSNDVVRNHLHLEISHKSRERTCHIFKYLH